MKNKFLHHSKKEGADFHGKSPFCHKKWPYIYLLCESWKKGWFKWYWNGIISCMALSYCWKSILEFLHFWKYCPCVFLFKFEMRAWFQFLFSTEFVSIYFFRHKFPIYGNGLLLCKILALYIYYVLLQSLFLFIFWIYHLLHITGIPFCDAICRFFQKVNSIDHMISILLFL